MPEDNDTAKRVKLESARRRLQKLGFSPETLGGRPNPRIDHGNDLADIIPTISYGNKLRWPLFIDTTCGEAVSSS